MITCIKKLIPFLLLGTIIFHSCEDVLDVPLTSELESTYFENENRVQRGVGSIYAVIQTLYGANLLDGMSTGAGVTLHPAWLLQGDDLTTSGNSNGAYEAFSGFSPSDVRVAEIWEKLYFVVNRANFMLEKLEDPEIVKVFKTTGLKDNNKGEALFLKAWANFRLWDIYRKAPLQEKRISSIDGAILKPSKGFELLDAAIADLIVAADLLPVSWNAQNKGRVFKTALMGYW
ncbi:MAG: RagB/SusD family nutrient uptake outer membrane protein [Bacteroidales bacterium]|nr:RagB/SusD family nutrient uptake outer membrane protein [Bacteroidales bacterium]